MADQRRWFKVWTSIVGNAAFAEMSLEDIGRWTLLGASTALDGDRGKLSVPGEGKELCRILRVSDLGTAKAALKRLKSVTFEEGKNRDAEHAVTWRNWQRYQEDSTARERMKSLRSKRRREEKRREEKRTSSPDGEGEGTVGVVKDPDPFASWPPDWGPVREKIQTMPFLARYQHWLTNLDDWKSEDEKFDSVKATIAELATGAAAYCQREGYRPRTKKGLWMKLHNCMEFEARRIEREAQRR